MACHKKEHGARVCPKVEDNVARHCVDEEEVDKEKKESRTGQVQRNSGRGDKKEEGGR